MANMRCNGVAERNIHVTEPFREKHSINYEPTLACPLSLPLRQRSVHSPLKFVVVIDRVKNCVILTDEEFWIQIDETLVVALDVVDDICLLKDDQGKAQERLIRETK